MCTRRWRRSIFFASCAVFGHFDKLSKVSWKSANSCLKKFYNIWQDLTLSLWRYLEQHLNLTEKWIRLWLLWNPGVNSPKILFVWLSAAPSLTGKVTVNLLLKVLCCSNRNNFLLFMNFTRFIKKILCLPEFQKIAMATAIGFAIMGFIGFFVKLIHIPINNIIV